MDQQTSNPQALDDFLGVQPQTPRQRALKWSAIGLGVLLLLVLAWRLLGGSGDAVNYATEPLAKGDLTVTVSATGNLAPTNKIEVGSEVSGLVENVYVDANDRVVKGQVLARLDISKLSDAVSRSRAQVAAGLAAVQQAQASRGLANANLARLQDVYRLSGGKVPSATELDSARSQSAQAVGALRSAQATVAQARAQLNSDQTNLAKASIVSPVTGVVLSREIDAGQTVAASFNTPKLFVIAEDLSRMKLEVAVDEADVGLVAAGQQARFAVDAFPGRKFPATIERVNLGSTSTSTTASNSVVSYTAVLKVMNGDGLLRPGMTATADIVTSEHKNVFLVPNAALRFKPSSATKKGILSNIGPPAGAFGTRGPKTAKADRGAKRQIFVKGPDGQPQAVTVTVGSSNGTQTEVSGEGLREGMDVITSTLSTVAK